MTNFSLGPSWLPKLGALIVAIGGAMALVPPTAPGAIYFNSYSQFIMAVGTGIIGFTSRQNNVTSEQVVTQKPPAQDESTAVVITNARE